MLWGALVVALALLTPTPSAVAAEPDEIVWGRTAFQPFYIYHGDEVSGIGYGIEQVLRRRMPEYDHSQMLMNTARVLHQMQVGENVCCTMILRTPDREEYLTFSLPSLTFPPPAAVVRRADAARYGEGPISLEQVLERGDVRVAVVERRRYGGRIDEVLERMADTDTLVEVFSPHMGGQVVEMLLEDRFDMTIAYPMEAAREAQELGREGEVAVIPLAENQDYVVGHVACPKTGWGRSVIARVDAVLADEVPTKGYLDIFLPYVPRDIEPEFLRNYHRLLARPALDFERAAP